MVYRNVEQLDLHLAALENGVGKDSGCNSVDIAVRDLMRIGISAREAKQDRARQQSEQSVRHPNGLRRVDRSRQESQ